MFAQSREFLISILSMRVFTPSPPSPSPLCSVTFAASYLSPSFRRRPFAPRDTAAIEAVLLTAETTMPRQEETSLARKLPEGIMLFYFWLIATRGRRRCCSGMNIQRRRSRRPQIFSEAAKIIPDYVRHASRLK